MNISRKKLDICIAKTCKSIKDIASEAGVDVVTINRILSGTQQPRRATIGKIAKALNVDVVDILEE